MAAPVSTAWQNRIVGYGEEDPTQLLANPRNWRIHPKSQQKALEGAIDQVGIVATVTVNRRTGFVVDGHLRVELAISRDQPTIPVTYVDLSDEEERIVLASLDPLAAMAGTDEEKLRELLASVIITDDDLGKALRRLAPEPRSFAGDEDAVPDAPDEPYVKAGDLWLLGDHRLFVGDATNPDHVAALLAGERPGIMVTDPPYGVEYDPTWRVDAARTSRESRIGAVMNDDRADWSPAWALSPADVAYVWHAGLHAHTVADSLLGAGYALRAQIIWVKPTLQLSRGDYQWRHEPCWYVVREGATGRRNDDRTQSTVWEIEGVRWGRSHGEDEATSHGTQKPVAAMEQPLMNHERMDVYDPFVGSGTTMIAAEKQGVRCFALDLDPRYAQVAIERWQTFTGKEARRG